MQGFLFRVYIVQNVGDIVIAVDAKIDVNKLFQWAAEHGVEVMRNSAVEGTNIEALFESVAESLGRRSIRPKIDTTIEKTVQLEIKQGQKQKQEKTCKDGGCCK